MRQRAEEGYANRESHATAPRRDAVKAELPQSHFSSAPARPVLRFKVRCDTALEKECYQCQSPVLFLVRGQGHFGLDFFFEAAILRCTLSRLNLTAFGTALFILSVSTTNVIVEKNSEMIHCIADFFLTT